MKIAIKKNHFVAISGFSLLVTGLVVTDMLIVGAQKYHFMGLVYILVFFVALYVVMDYMVKTRYWEREIRKIAEEAFDDVMVKKYGNRAYLYKEEWIKNLEKHLLEKHDKEEIVFYLNNKDNPTLKPKDDDVSN